MNVRSADESAKKEKDGNNVLVKASEEEEIYLR